MKVIITGGEGFIGKALAAYLSVHGNEVIIVDRKSGMEAGEYFSTHDLSDIDCVFHLAAQTSVFNANKTDVIRETSRYSKPCVTPAGDTIRNWSTPHPPPQSLATPPRYTASARRLPSNMRGAIIQKPPV